MGFSTSKQTPSKLIFTQNKRKQHIMNFTHLHVHSHYSILDGMSKVPDLIDKCMRTGMRAMALTDHGNMFGIKEFLDYSAKVNGAPKKKLNECKENIKKAQELIAQIPKLEADLKTVTDSFDADKLKQMLADAHKVETELPKWEAELPILEQKLADFVPFKPIVGVEAYCARRSRLSKDASQKEISANGKEQITDYSGWHLILLAKNKTGYHNLCKMVSLAFIEGKYGRPRIDKELLTQYHEGIIVSSACFGGELPQLIMKGKIDEAEASIRWFKSVFGDDYYIELQRHKTDKPGGDQEVYMRQQEVNPILIELARKTDTKIICTNDAHFVEEEHADAHDHLICVSTGTLVDETRRMHYTKQEWLKTPAEMAAIFSDLPEALANTQEIVDKVEAYSIDADPIMPKFPIPETFGTEDEYRRKFTEQDLFDEFTRNEKGEVVLSQEAAEKKIKKLGGYDKLYRIKFEADYLAKLAWDGAHERYGENLTDEQIERITFELHIMKTMGFPGYFLIVRDYIRAAREELGMFVGPGRGSAAGSVVAYCLKITDVDPLKYDLLFERFLNPDRISLPDIDVDFDDTSKIIDWVTKKYGVSQVARIITYGTMAAKSAIADVSRVKNIPLSTVAEIKTYIPDKLDDVRDPATGKTFAQLKEEKKIKKVPKPTLANCYKYIDELRNRIHGSDPAISSMLTTAGELEDTIRQIGVHACGVIIGADDLTKFAPLASVYDKNLKKDIVVTEYDGHVIESVGLIKMDFLGLQTLTIIKEALSNIKKSQGKEIDIDHIPLDDAPTYKLFQEGRTIAVFQFESPGMQKYMKELQPTVITDLIAMNALYRPGPIENIPSFIARKQGKEPITYDLPCMEKYLKDTYGITVYQEQVMLLSREIAGFTRGQSDQLRKAMGKKIAALLDELYPKFIEGGKKNGYQASILNSIWETWLKFAEYAFNKSHSTCYAWLAYQTAYLKANFPAEFMAANLTISKDDIKEVTKLMDECKAMKIIVKGPDINESDLTFTVNQNGIIRFGLGGIKGVGESAVEAIVNERKANGAYKSIHDFVERVNLAACNRKAIESMALAGCFDTFGEKIREQMLTPTSKGDTFIEQLITYGNRYQQDQSANQNSLFGSLDCIEIAKPTAPNVTEWSTLDKLNKEKEMVGIYISAHPLDRYKVAIQYGCSHHAADLATLISRKTNTTFTIGGLVVNTREGRTKTDKPYGILTIEDYTGQYEFPLFGQDYVDYGKFLKKDLFLIIHGCSQQRGLNWKWGKQNNDEPQKWELKIQSIDMLDDKADTLIRNISIDIPLSHIDPMFITNLNTLFTDEAATVEFYINVHDNEERYLTSLRSRKYHLKADINLFNQLEQWKKEEVITDFHINT